ncbi:MAG: tetratricopeptide repeat protein [Gemmatimonadota bacterium]|nr:tetratricopeptide repeat protein [Gemmatimonadota bacterium]
MKLIRSVLLAAVLTLLGTAPTVAQTGHDLFQQALVKERADGDLRGAIAIYERIAQEFAADRALAAKALVQTGRCHEKLGNEDAQRAYWRVVQEYPDQTDMAQEARMRLSALQRVVVREGPSGVVVREVPYEGRPSFDGRHVVYTDWTTFDIAIRDMRADTTRRLTTTGSPGEQMQLGMDPALSPDGRYVAYEWHDPTSQSYFDLRIVPADGSGPPRVLYDTSGFYMMGPTWSWDGKHIAIARYPTSTLYHTITDDARTDLIWVSVDDGSVRVLNSYAPSGYQGLSHSPDDRYVVHEVYVEGDSVQSDIFVTATDGSGSRPIVEHPATDRLLGWIPGTEWVLFLSDRANMWGAWAVRVVGGHARGEPRLVHAGMGHTIPKGFNGAGDLHYLVPVRWFRTYVAAFDAVTGEVDTASAQLLPGSTTAPEWSPDGLHLAFRAEESYSRLGTYPRRLRTLDITTGEIRPLAAHLDVSGMRWSLDGESIVVSAFDESAKTRNHHGGVYRVDVNTGDVQFLIELPRDPGWWYGHTGVLTTDGGSLFYARQGLESQGETKGTDGVIVRRDLLSGTELELYRHPNLLARFFSVSPTEQYLVFAVMEDEGARLMIMDVATRSVRELARSDDLSNVERVSVSWTSDGQHVMYLLTDKSGSTFWRASVAGGDPEQLLRSFPFQGAISSDGSHLAYTVGQASDRHMVMENLKAVLER